MKFLLDKVPDKPIYFELRTQLRRSSSGAFKGNQIATLIVVLVMFSIVAYTFITGAEYIPLAIPMFFLPGLVSLVIPGVLNSVISGELQKRSLEPLLAAPLTPFQLVRAKSLRAVMPLALCLLSSFALIFLLLVGKAGTGDSATDGMYPPFLSIMVGVAVFLTYSYCLVGITLAVSSVTRSAVASLLTTYGILFGLFAILPAIIGPTVAAISPTAVMYFAALHPYGILSLASFTNMDPGLSWEAVTIISLGAMVGYTVIGFLAMGFAANRLENFKKSGTGA